MRYRLGTRIPQLIGAGHFIADNAAVIGSVTLESHASVWFGAVLRGDNEPLHIGANSNIQDGAVLHTDMGAPLTIAANVTVGHQAMLHGCSVGEGSLIGIKAVILNHAVIGKNCLIGANALVTEGKVIPDNSLVIGSPGKVVRTLSKEEIAAMHANTAHYVENAAHYLAELEAIK
ncbi:MAG: gamma carbonic anhydrase family protein [Gallionella sp.]|jgi:carbonic anhydrase/acetyltransferase-like protein (isoleucine patch superfamily)|nr:gamma carbonic anhydrase family protein [Gallionella sp.]NNM80161.1 gamma carbonic anhydrase family protein [Gallionella sp.]